MKTHQFLISDHDQGRIDQYLARQEMGLSRSQISKLIQSGDILKNGVVTKNSDLIQAGDTIVVVIPPPQKLDLQAEDIALDILYEDDDLLVLNKAPMMVVHQGAGHSSGTLTHALLHHCGSLSTIGGVERPGIVHRLDKGTSGCMVIAKNDFTHQALSQQFKDHAVRKVYWAIVYGRLKEPEGTITSLLARSSHHRKKYASHPSKGKQAVTHYKTILVHKGLSHLEIHLETGRTHQIRVHMMEMGHSIVGDDLYGGHKKKAKGLPGQILRKSVENLTHTLLHSHELELTHPRTQDRLSFIAQIPEDFKNVINLMQ